MTDGIIRGMKIARDKVIGVQNAFDKKKDEIMEEFTSGIKSVLPDDWTKSETRAKLAAKHGEDTLKQYEASTEVKSLLSNVMGRSQKKKDFAKKMALGM